MSERSANVDRFYSWIARLDQACGGPRVLSECHGRMGWPNRGVYFFFESGETRADGVTPRVVRVGTHALRPSSSTLWTRLAQHRGTTGGSMPGGGNHRASIFRRHVGGALLASGNWPAEIAETWGVGSTATTEVRRCEYPLEQAVSECICAMPLLWLEVNDPPNRQSRRGVIERGSIGLLSNLDHESIDSPSPTWLGRSCDRKAVRASGLWNVNHVDDHCDPSVLDELDLLLEVQFSKSLAK